MTDLLDQAERGAAPLYFNGNKVLCDICTEPEDTPGVRVYAPCNCDSCGAVNLTSGNFGWAPVFGNK